ncbi:hypothetical protein Q5P01_000912 [Channa striata]|uniref:Uncharacterized protein n=1 Tax=Channa striata TaxID=64152 RepID=A0AA88IWQ2_CHASR|nr:hypothetical protein Q5P01_000912 [Channa striata]
MVEHGMAPTAVLRAQIHGLVVLEQLKRCGLPQYFHNFHVAGVTMGEFMTLGREESGWLLQRLTKGVWRRHGQELPPSDPGGREALSQSRGHTHGPEGGKHTRGLRCGEAEAHRLGSAHPIGGGVHSEFSAPKHTGAERISSRGLFAPDRRVWSLGILLYSMVRKRAFEENSEIVRGDCDSKPGSLTPAGT